MPSMPAPLRAILRAQIGDADATDVSDLIIDEFWTKAGQPTDIKTSAYAEAVLDILEIRLAAVSNDIATTTDPGVYVRDSKFTRVQGLIKQWKENLEAAQTAEAGGTEGGFAGGVIRLHIDATPEDDEV